MVRTLKQDFVGWAEIYSHTKDSTGAVISLYDFCLSFLALEHFCQTPHCNHKTCNKCRLWTKDEEDDARAMKEAGLKAAKNQDVQIDIDKILKDPTAKAAGRKNK